MEWEYRLIRLEPARLWFSGSISNPALAKVVPAVISWGGLLFDVSVLKAKWFVAFRAACPSVVVLRPSRCPFFFSPQISPILYSRYRYAIGIPLALLFNGANKMMFDIGIFPFLMAR